MGEQTQATDEFWRGVLGAGGPTRIPRWTTDPVTGAAALHVGIPGELAEELYRFVDELEVPLSSVLLTAHAKVLAALSGDRDVISGVVVVDGGEPLPCRLTTEPRSWRSLLLRTERDRTQLQAHEGFDVSSLRHELGMTEPPFETVLDPTGTDGPLDQDVVLRVGMSRNDGRLSLTLRYRTDVLDRDCAARIAHYHLAAIRLIVQDPDAQHARQTLLSAEELRFQLEGLAGPPRKLPDQRFHELFEQRVRAKPDAVAAVHGNRRWTYRQLNAHANRLGRALLARGLHREEVVAVVTERNLNWMASVLAILKAGGVYLPIEPRFPVERIAKMLTRARCRLVLTEPGSTTTLEPALRSLPDVQSLLIDSVCGKDVDDRDLGVDVAPDQLAYIYFTSGSTGEPKGAMCEHAGMLNHLLAKIDDLGIRGDHVVAQTAPQCFDISLWQLVSALLVGGQTLIVEQEVVLDVERFVDKIVERKIAVLQVVPSYLEAVLTYLERHPRELPDLHCVSVTGEALKTELVQRWFALRPDIRLVNAYGLTETSDDTNHEVMVHVPDTDRIPLGRPINNVRVYVVDEHLSPVPLGAPGLIAFSGICVGRGYVNDPERTRESFMADPHRASARLYQGGDYGRWLPDGKLEFLGRRDSQVKIRGFRIEIGDIENALLRVPGIRDGAVVVAEGADQGRHLVAFYSAQRPLDTDPLRDRLGESLPEYMVPSAMHWRQSLPLTGNGKIDRRALTALAGELGFLGKDRAAPITSSERWLAAAWAKVLGIPPEEISRLDHFFDRGGTSLTAVKLAVALDRAVSVKEVTRHPVLADLAGVLDGRRDPRSGLLQELSTTGGADAATLVCFPYAGGNAVCYQPLALELRGSGLKVYGVEPPGHDVSAQSEPPAPLVQTAEQVADEITRRGLTRIVLMGHSAGTALAMATARKLQEGDVAVERVFLCAQLLGDASGRRAETARLAALADQDIVSELNGDGRYTPLDELDRLRAGSVAAAYRHDCLAAHRYLADSLADPWTEKIAAPVSVIVAADDPVTAESSRRYRDWELLAKHVDLHELAEGGHNLLRSRPADVAAVVLRALDLPVSARGEAERRTRCRL